jgi:hypothetical protein
VFMITDWRGGWCCCIDQFFFFVWGFSLHKCVCNLSLSVCMWTSWWRIHMPLADFWSRSRTISRILRISFVIVFNGQTSSFALEVLYLPHLSPAQGADKSDNHSLLPQFSVMISLSGGLREVGSEVCLRELMHLHGWVVSRDCAGAWYVDAIQPFSHFLQYWVHVLNLIHPRTLPGIGKDGTIVMNVLRRTA